VAEVARTGWRPIQLAGFAGPHCAGPDPLQLANRFAKCGDICVGTDIL